MKKNVIKTAVAAVCVVAAGMGSFKAYNAAAQSEADILLAENVEALSQVESIISFYCKDALGVCRDPGWGYVGLADNYRFPGWR